MTRNDEVLKKAREALAKPTLPEVPDSLPSVLGPVPVVRVKELRSVDGTAAFGIWRSSERDVRLEADMDITTAWLTYWHEWVHVVLWDAGVRMKKVKEERLCDTIAQARVREMLDGSR